MKQTLVKLNLGCGKDIKKDWENYDKHPIDKRVKYVDLKNLPLPFSDDYADEILVSHVVEHLVYRHEFMVDLFRILKPAGKITVRLPTFNTGIDHKSVLHNSHTMGTFARYSDINVTNFRYYELNFINCLKKIYRIIMMLCFDSCEWEIKKTRRKKP